MFSSSTRGTQNPRNKWADRLLDETWRLRQYQYPIDVQIVQKTLLWFRFHIREIFNIEFHLDSPHVFFC